MHVAALTHAVWSGPHPQELGHGSNLRSLETTATYDPKTESWDIHTPCLTAAKWWPGGLGKTSTHALVMARLVTLGEDHGIAPFLVQLRRQEDHEPMPGVTLGDIGPKYGYVPLPWCSVYRTLVFADLQSHSLPNRMADAHL